MSQSICETFLQLPACEEQAPSPAAAEPRRALTQISGAWNGIVAIDCSPQAARRVASVMLGVPTADLSDADLRDGVLELANVIGGNIKALLPEPCRLSVPVDLNDHAPIDLGVTRLVAF